jgi:hypothetical protein
MLPISRSATFAYSTCVELTCAVRTFEVPASLVQTCAERIFSVPV